MEMSFGERFARTWAAGLAGLGLFTLMALVAAPGGLFPLLAVAQVLALSAYFRRRALHDAAHRRRALEDERDRALLALGDRAFRLAASTWMVGMALALGIVPSRELLLAPPLRLPGLLLLGVIVAQLAGHGAVAVAYRRDRA